MTVSGIVKDAKKQFIFLLKTLKVLNQIFKYLSISLSPFPISVRGTSLLSHSSLNGFSSYQHSNSSNNQWLESISYYYHYYWNPMLQINQKAL